MGSQLPEPNSANEVSIKPDRRKLSYREEPIRESMRKRANLIERRERAEEGKERDNASDLTSRFLAELDSGTGSLTSVRFPACRVNSVEIVRCEYGRIAGALRALRYNETDGLHCIGVFVNSKATFANLARNDICYL